MKNILLSKVRFFEIVLFVSSIGFLFMTQLSHADALEGLSKKLPNHIMGWKAAGQDQIYDPITIFGYINGGAEVYKAYNMRACLSRRYTNPGQPSIVLDIFDMGSSIDAFGVFTHDTDGDVLDIGQDSRFRPAWLSFWKSRFFISIYMEEETAASENTVKRLGRQVAAQISEEGIRPHILSLLPAIGLESKNIRYLHHPAVLNYHYYLSDQNLLNISSKNRVVLAPYHQGKESALLFLATYDDSQTAISALKSFLKHYLPDADASHAALLENGKWSVAGIKGELLAIVLEADSREFAHNLIARVFEKE